jgi:hypothetical protein
VQPRKAHLTSVAGGEQLLQLLLLLLLLLPTPLLLLPLLPPLLSLLLLPLLLLGLLLLGLFGLPLLPLHLLAPLPLLLLLGALWAVPHAVGRGWQPNAVRVVPTLARVTQHHHLVVVGASAHLTRQVTGDAWA